MALASLSSRAIKGRLFHDLSTVQDAWVQAIAGTPIKSDQASETYAAPGNVAGLREWIGQRFAKTLKTYEITILNRKYEDTLLVYGDELRRDKTTFVERRINQLKDRYDQHWPQLATALLVSNPIGYDGKALYATDHVDPGESSGTQDNALTLNATDHTNLTVAEMEAGIMALVTAILAVKDNHGLPMNPGLTSFTIMVPVQLMAKAAAALNAPIITEGSGARTNILSILGGFSFNLVVNPFLTYASATPTIYAFANNGLTLIRQNELDLKVSAKAEGSEFEHDTDSHEYGIMCIRAIGPGSWQTTARLVFT